MVVRTAMPGILMFACVLLGKELVDGTSMLVELILAIAFGASSYAVFVLLLCRPEIVEARNVFRRGENKPAVDAQRS